MGLNDLDGIVARSSAMAGLHQSEGATNSPLSIAMELLYGSVEKDRYSDGHTNQLKVISEGRGDAPCKAHRLVSDTPFPPIRFLVHSFEHCGLIAMKTKVKLEFWFWDDSF